MLLSRYVHSLSASRRGDSAADASTRWFAAAGPHRNRDDDDVFGALAKKPARGGKAKKPEPKKVPDAVRLPLGVMDSLNKFEIAIPTTIAEVHDTIAALEAKRDYYEKRQEVELRQGLEEERREQEAARAAAEAAKADAATADDVNGGGDAAPEAEAEEKEEGEI